ncbi:lysophospholipid acyltransferase family protein [Rhizobium sp. TH2]|uniref:lysophospholipid acyltransferase family protein n=1 Tax=Rhizobium sp. TH2 TaxID=2775403 RepID=UPI002157130E|nr:lysophospholipid acyltransferase family protein [Rhizobium sp. TH2]UVC11117.1 lysophospholipid acyltransferase family protein [Rhizobium sp. TH2]
MRFKELSYANETDPLLKRLVIHTVENLSGRNKYVEVYKIWRSEVVGKSDRVFSRMLELIDIDLSVKGNWPPKDLPAGPIVMVANHPYGIADGIAVLALAEQLGRPFKILINDQLLKVPEMRPYSLPISFEETREGLAINLATRNEALRLLKDGVTIVIFPGGGVATAPKGFGQAEDLPWKMFPAKLIQAAKASVLPVYFEGQNGWMFHLASRFSLTLRLSLLIREFCRLSGRTIFSSIGMIVPWEDIAPITDRKAILQYLYDTVFAMGAVAPRPKAA